MDIDHGCCLMAQINVMLQGVGMGMYGAVESALDVDAAALTQLPQPYRDIYEDAQTAVATIVAAAPPATQQHVKEDTIRDVAAAVGKTLRGKHANQLTLWENLRRNYHSSFQRVMSMMRFRRSHLWRHAARLTRFLSGRLRGVGHSSRRLSRSISTISIPICSCSRSRIRPSSKSVRRAGMCGRSTQRRRIIRDS